MIKSYYRIITLYILKKNIREKSRNIHKFNVYRMYRIKTQEYQE